MHKDADRLVLFLSLALVAFHCLSLARSVPAYCAALARWCRAAVGSCPRRRQAAEQEQDLISECVSRQIDAQRLPMMRSTARMAASACCVVALSIVYNIVYHRPRWMSQAQDFSFLGGFAVFGLLSACPGLIGNRTRTLWYSLQMAWCTSYAISSSGLPYRVLLSSSLMIRPRLVFSLAFLEVRAVAAWNVASTVAQVLAFVYSEDQSEHGECHYHDVAANRSSFLVFELAASVVVTIIMAGWQRFNALAVRKEVEARNLQSETSAVRTVLNTVCDVVMVLDAELRMVDQSSKFAALLMLSPSRILSGAKIQDFMLDEENRKRFEAHLLAPGVEAAPMAGAVHVKMRDSLGSTLQMEVFNATFVGLDDCTHHLIGLREFTDVPAAALRPRPQNAAPSGPQPETARPAGAGAVDGEQEAGRHGLQGAGTPAFVASSPLAGGGSSSQAMESEPSVSSSSLAQRARPWQAHLQRTQDQAIDFTVLESMMMWNLPVQRASCCRMHAYVLELKRVMRGLSKRDCMPSFQQEPVTEWQCAGCGIFDDGQAGCGCCGGDDFVPTSRRCSL